MEDPQAELAAAAAAFSAVLRAVDAKQAVEAVRSPADLKTAAALRAEIAQQDIEAAAVLAAETVTTDELLSLAARYRRLTAGMFDLLISVDSDRKM